MAVGSAAGYISGIRLDAPDPEALMTLTLDAGREPIPGYRLVRLLGEGGFGQVWQASAPGGVQVALKFIRLDSYQAAPELRALEVVKNIRHPHLLDIQFATRVHDRLVLAMALCDRSLWDRFEECRKQGLPGIPVDELLEYMQDAAKALDYLNEVRHIGADGRKIAVAHRDIKPHNIFLVGGSVKLADFGLVKALEQSAATNTGSMTPAYAAPELFSRTVSPRSDQWSLAVTYYQVRTSLLPFTGSMHEMMFAILQQDPDLGAVPPDERAVLARALEKDPENRWPSCREFVKALVRAVPSRSSLTVAGTTPSGAGRTEATDWGADGPTIDASQSDRRRRTAGGAGFDTRSPSQAAAETSHSPHVGATPSPPALSAKTETPSVTQDIFDRPTVYLDRKDLLPRPEKGRGAKRDAGAARTESVGRRKLFAAGGVLLTACVLTAAIYFSTRGVESKPPPAPLGEQTTSDAEGKTLSPSVVAGARPVKPEPKPLAKPTTLHVHVQPSDLSLEVDPKANIEGNGADRIVTLEGMTDDSTVTLVAIRDGYRTERQTVTVSPGESKRIEISLKPMPAVLTVEVSPVDAQVEVRGGSATVTGEGAVRTIEVADSHQDLSLTVFVAKKGYRGRHQEWKPKIAENQKIKLALDPYPAVLTLDVEPTDAQIRVVSGAATITGSGKSRRIEVVKPIPGAVVAILATRQGWKERRIEWIPKPGATERREVVLERAPLSQEIRDSVGIHLALVPAGQFSMGSKETPEELAKLYAKSEAAWFADERPLHSVTITQPFYMGKCEVTVGQFRAFVRATGYKTEGERDGKGGWGWNDRTSVFENSPKFDWLSTGFRQTDEHPVVNVSYNDAVAFCQWLSKKEGALYRLPTEAEWEYACRAGTTSLYPFGRDLESAVGFGNTADATAKEVLSKNYSDWGYLSRSDGYVFTSPAGSFRANAFGLYDMIGNVWEWCGDYYSPNYYAVSPTSDPVGPDQGSTRILRGGGWSNTSWNCRSADRFGLDAAYRDFNVGFRVVRLAEE